MPASEFSAKLSDNINRIEALFEHDMTLKKRSIVPIENPQLSCTLFYVDTIVKFDVLNDFVIRPLVNMLAISRHEDGFMVIKESVISVDEVKEITTESDLLSDLCGGNSILFIEGYDKALSLNTRGWSMRGISEPESERVLRGSREGFIETLVVNVSMVRRRISSPKLKFEFRKVGGITHTNVAICYIDGLVEPSILRELKKRLDKLNFDSVLDSNYINERIRDNPRSPFRTIASTERPDVVAGKLLEGRIALLVDGTPVALTLPCIFTELMQSPEDYYLNYYYASFGRIMRMACVFLSFSIPAIYLALITFHQELIPPPLLISITRARSGVPLPSFLEAVILLLAFDLLRETGTRMPSSIGQSLSIVGALVLGQAAVEAHFVSAPMIIIIASSGIASLIVPRIAGAVNIIKYVLLVFAAIYGLYGFIAGFTMVLALLFSMESFGVPYMAYSSILGVSYWQDIYVRAPWSKMKRRPFFSRNRNRSAGEENE